MNSRKMSSDVCNAIGESITKYYGASVGGHHHIDGIRAFLESLDKLGFSIVPSEEYEEQKYKADRYDHWSFFMDDE